MSIYEKAVGVKRVTPEQIVVDMSNTISLLKPAVYPLTTILSRLSKSSVHNYRFDWLEEELSAVWATCGAGATASATTVNVATGEGALFAVGDIVRVTATNELIRVTGVTADALTVTRNFGDNINLAIPAGGMLMLVSSAYAQGTGAGAEKSTHPKPVFNYTQIFKTPFSVTGTLDAMKLYGGNEYDRLANRKGIEHGRSIEQALLFGQRKLDTSGPQPLSTMGGIDQFLRASRYQALNQSAVTYEKLIDMMEDVFTYGSSEKLWLVSPAWISQVQKIAKNFLQIIQSDNDKTMGLSVTKLTSPHGTLNMVQHPLFVQGLAGYSTVLDIEELAYRPLKGRDTTLKPNVQLPDEDGRRDMYMTEAGLELKQPKKHKIYQMNLGA